MGRPSTIFIIGLILFAQTVRADRDRMLESAIKRYSEQEIIALDVDEEYVFVLKDGSRRIIRLVSVKEHRDSVIRKVRRAEVDVQIDGKPIRLICAPYVMPTETNGLRIQADTTSGWLRMPKKVQFSIWDATDPIVNSEQFVFPIANYLLFSHGMQAYNEVVHLGHRDGDPKGQTFYHDYGIDVAGYDGREEIVSPVDGRVIEIWPSGDNASSVVVGNDDGLLFSLSHLDSILPSLREGSRVEKGGKIGMLGKKGASGNFSHLHLGPWLSISALKAKKRCRNLNLYPWLVTTYHAQYGGHLYAIARPHHTVLTGEEILFDGSNSLAFGTKIASYKWQFHDGATVEESKASKTYNSPGTYIATLWVRDEKGRQDVDFCKVKVFEKSDRKSGLPTIFMTHTPTADIAVDRPVLFQFWIQGGNVRQVMTVDFGDGTIVDDYLSYSEVKHGFKTPGIHVVTARAMVGEKPITQKQKVVVRGN
jgi:murein DD-endopeptidase MepM/ murein hydrolase activator NlpD